MHQPSVPDCYLVLGIHPDASKKDIRIAYKELALKLHPDKGGGNHEGMQQVNEAYEILSDVGQRYEYDTEYPTINRQWQRYRAWKAKAANGEQQKPKTSAKPKTSKSGKPKPKKASKKKPKPKKVKGQLVKVKRETESEDIGPRFKALIAHGIETTVEEHAKNCGCRLFQAYKTKPEVEYSYDEEEDDEYVDED